MRKILIILMITVGLLAGDKEWTKYKVDTFIVYAKSDKRLPLNFFGFIKRYDIYTSQEDEKNNDDFI